MIQFPIFQFSSSCLYIGHCFQERMRLNEWMRVWCSESGNFAARIALMVRNSSFLVHSRSSTQYISQSSFLAEPDGWLTCAKRQSAKLSKVVREFSSKKRKPKSNFKSTKFPPSSKDRKRINSPALSTSIWARLEGFFAQCLPTMFLATTVLAC